MLRFSPSGHSKKNNQRPYKVRGPPQLLVYKALNYSYPPETIFKQVKWVNLGK